MENNELRLLYIEENYADIHLLKSYVEYHRLPISIKAFMNCADAFKFLRTSTESIDVILLDFCLIGRDCIDVLKQIKSDEKSGDIPVIVFSNWADEDYRINCLENKADHFVVKPRGFDEYSGLIRIISGYRTKDSRFK